EDIEHTSEDGETGLPDGRGSLAAQVEEETRRLAARVGLEAARETRGQRRREGLATASPQHRAGAEALRPGHVDGEVEGMALVPVEGDQVRARILSRLGAGRGLDRKGGV